MSASELTKRVLSEGIKELMEKTPLSKISVGDICAHCGISRNTFYYHFKDKFDLVNWIFYTESMGHLTNFASPDAWADGLIELFRYLQENRRFYINALEVIGQNSFSEYLLEFYRNLLVACIHELKGDKSIGDEEIDFISRFFAHAIAGMIMDWAKAGMKKDPALAIAYIRELINSNLLLELQQNQDGQE